MKRALVLALTLVVLFTASAAAGPFLGLSVTPSPGSAMGLSFGYQFSDWAVDLTKTNFATWTGAWGVGAFWTPVVQSGSVFGPVRLRVGPVIRLAWTTEALTYNGLGLSVGVMAWRPVSAYIAVDIASDGVLTPRVGVQFEFRAPEDGDQ